MNTLFDILQSAQNGAGIDNLTKQFGLTTEQTQSALQALLPAFSFGLKSQAATENPFSSLSFEHLDSFTDAGVAASQQAVEQGNQMLGALFGSKDASRAVAQQAADLSGVGSSVLKQMLPVIASMLMGGLMKGAQRQPGLQDIFGQMMGGGASAPAASGSLADVFGQMLGGGMAAPAGDNTLASIFGSLFGGGAPAKPPVSGAADPGAIFGQMFEAGAQAQRTQADAMQSILESFLGKR